MLLQVVRSRKGLSEMVSYVLLIVIVISMSVLIYNYMEGFIPRYREVCPEGVSLIVREYTCSAVNKTLSLTLQNKGLFTVEAYVLRASDDPLDEIATKYLDPIDPLNPNLNPGFIPLVSLDGKGLAPGEESVQNLNYSSLSGDLAFIEITPFIITPDKKTTICGNNRIKEVVQCE